MSYELYLPLSLDSVLKKITLLLTKIVFDLNPNTFTY